MRRIIDIFRKSFSARVSLYAVLAAAGVFLLALSYVSRYSRRSVWDEATKRASQVLENCELRLTRILEDVEAMADNVEWLVYRHLDSPDTLVEYTRTALQGNPDLVGCAISFEPYFFEGEEYFSAYSSRDENNVITTEQEGDEDYQYFYLDWYLMPKLLNQPVWTEPYCDWDYDDDFSLNTEMLISYSKPLTDAEGNFIGVVSMDLSPKWLSEQLSSIKPYPHSFCMLLSRGGTYLIHPDPERLFYQTIFTRNLLENDPLFEKLGHDMLDQKEGTQLVKITGQDSYAFYKPMKKTGWSLGIVCMEKDIFDHFDRLRIITLVILLLGLLAMFIASIKIIGGTMKPLKALVAEAENIAEGDFGHKLPELNRVDEIGTLSRSFSHMQSSLVSYIEELKETTATKERIDGELRIAHSIQMAMVPSVFPAFPERKELDLYACMNPAKEVGGDLYDYFLLDDKLYFCIGDVSGKGIPASLFMATTRNLFRVVGKEAVAPSEIARRLNATLSENNETLMFVTAFIGVLDLVSGRLEFCNCGHNPPVLIPKAGGKAADTVPAFLDCIPNTPIGACPDCEFKGQEIEDLHGCTLFLYTDGLTEAENRAHEAFGDWRLLENLANYPRVNPEALVSRLRGAVASHVGSAEPSDDLTILCLELK